MTPGPWTKQAPWQEQDCRRNEAADGFTPRLIRISDTSSSTVAYDMAGHLLLPFAHEDGEVVGDRGVDGQQIENFLSKLLL